MPELLVFLLGKLEYVFAIVTLLGGVIAVHELGHFLMAKWNGIRVDTFSIGFGPKLFSKKWGETEYCLSLIPLGGFVKIYGQDPEELTNDPEPKPDRAFANKGLGAKISVLAGGPLFNYLLSIGIFGLLAVAGVQKLPPVATRVVADTPAYQAGLRSGDTITAINGQPTRTFEEVAELIAKNPEKSLQFSILREGANRDLNIQVQKEHALTPYGEESVAGVLEGLDPLAREPFVAVSGTQAWGFQSGDRVLEMDSVPVSSWEDMEKNLPKALATQEKIRFKVKRGAAEVALESGDIRALAKQAKGDANRFLELAGLYNPELVIQNVVGGAPASLAGVKTGDRIVTAGGVKVNSFDHLRSVIQDRGEQTAKASTEKSADGIYANALKLQIQRDGKMQELSSAIRATEGRDPLGDKIVTYTIGIESAGKPKMPANLITERTYNPFKALWIGSVETVNHTVMTVVGLKKLAFGEVSAKTVGGPIMIGKLAGDTFASRGWRDFLRIMAIISISLGVFNLIPIPILDGGHIVFAVIESLRGRPLSQQVQQAALKVGLSLILVLMVFALYNDITRVWR